MLDSISINFVWYLQTLISNTAVKCNVIHFQVAVQYKSNLADRTSKTISAEFETNVLFKAL